MFSIEDLKVKIFADGADLLSIMKANEKPFIKGFTTNPTLMRKAGVSSYESFSRELLHKISDKPVSLEVFADDEKEIFKQAKKINSWGANVFVKIPVTNTNGDFMGGTLKALSSEGIPLNITAMMTTDQVYQVMEATEKNCPLIFSVFAGRIADTGRDPVSCMKECLSIISSNSNAELLWASPRELYNIFQANEIGCHIITVGDSILDKVGLIGKNLDEYSLETVVTFFEDAKASGFEL